MQLQTSLSTPSTSTPCLPIALAGTRPPGKRFQATIRYAFHESIAESVWYAIVDQSHNIVIGVDSIDVSETLTIDDLKERILEEQGYRDINPALTNVY
ncbi:hypothetical protein Agabi119p4_3291 [Agaricus bisporus var. burnettii]|uniref:Uncharacterized protein n=1 Tax=Agaricus bisporus var. burnettii TaxID=192524 RepID=A0A8H7F6U6_AGABI|nr:hypothetical protein Agabi119p4_3291 [Agaricus bisporus var. burnettii]